jgi:hypothetical protein
MSDIEITVEDMLADDPELTEDDFEVCEEYERDADALQASFDARSDERLERSRGLDY